MKHTCPMDTTPYDNNPNPFEILLHLLITKIIEDMKTRYSFSNRLYFEDVPVAIQGKNYEIKF